MLIAWNVQVKDGLEKGESYYNTRGAILSSEQLPYLLGNSEF